MSAEALSGVILVWAWLGTGYLLVDAERWPVGVRVASYIIYTLMAALAIQMCCAMINIWWKISTHTAAIGGVAGSLQAFAILFGFNPMWWLCLVFVVGGMVGTSRMVLLQHTLWQVVAGFLTGQAVAFVLIMANYV